MAFPPDNQTDLEAFYGRHELKQNGQPTARWERDHLTTMSTPYPLTLSWDLAVQVRRITCHKLVAPSLAQILNEILAHYGSLNAVRTARMHLFGGCYNYRRISGGGRLSTHAWGAGIDLDPDRNPLGVPHSESTGMMPLAVVAIFDRHGWRWGGRFVSRPDCMHFQATTQEPSASGPTSQSLTADVQPSDTKAHHESRTAIRGRRTRARRGAGRM